MTITPEMIDPNAAAEKLGARYQEIIAGEWACCELVCQFPYAGNCECFNTALAESMEQARLSGKLEAEREIVAWLRGFVTNTTDAIADGIERRTNQEQGAS